MTAWDSEFHDVDDFFYGFGEGGSLAFWVYIYTYIQAKFYGDNASMDLKKPLPLRVMGENALVNVSYI